MCTGVCCLRKCREIYDIDVGDVSQRELILLQIACPATWRRVLGTLDTEFSDVTALYL